MYNPRELFAFIASQQAQGRRIALVTVMHTTGASVRNPGSHMAVAEDGSYAGSLSGGCIEAAVVSEAQAMLAAGTPRRVRIGAGSSNIDLRLPCGGSVDLWFCEVRDADFGTAAIARFNQRVPFALHLAADGAISIGPTETARFGIRHSGEQACVTHIPPLRLLAIGHAAAIDALRDLTLATGAEVVVVSPDSDQRARSEQRGCHTITLKSQTELPALPLDRWTGAAVLFHDHDWEPPLLGQLLASEAFYIGAMGSHVTHRQRCAALRAMGATDAMLARITAPIGVIPSMRDPETLAISVLAQAVERYNAAYLT